MSLNQERLQSLLAPRPVRFYAQAGSTNDIAREWLLDGAPAGAVVIADEQVQGRGRLGRAWHTPAGSALALSVVLHPTPEALPRLSMLGALAVADLAAQPGAADVGIKWPNDVQIGGLKVSGVLPEAVWQGAHLAGAVLGLGVNVRVDFAGTDLQGKATSLETALGRRLDRAELAQALLACIERWYGRIGTEAFFAAWQGRLSTLGQWVTVGDVQGQAEAVNADGALLVRDASGEIHQITAGDLAIGMSS